MTGSPVLLLDGGFSNELSKRCSYDIDKDPLWTAKALLTDPNAVTETHYAYPDAGADIIETATYQATLKGLNEGLNLSVQECEDLIGNSVIMAKNAVSRYKSLHGDGFTSRQDILKSQNLRIPLIAGSIGPYGVYLHDGSEYTGNYMEKVSDESIVNLHSRRIQILMSRNVDILSLETMPSLKEVEILLKHIENQNGNMKVWVSFTLQENDPSRTVCGDLVTDVFKLVSQYSFVWGFGTNCVNPKNVSSFLKQVSSARNEVNGNHIRLIVYPNLGRTWISGQGWSNEEVPPIAAYAEEWMELGANVIEGCCQVGPDEIRKLRTVVNKWNSKDIKSNLP